MVSGETDAKGSHQQGRHSHGLVKSERVLLASPVAENMHQRDAGSHNDPSVYVVHRAFPVFRRLYACFQCTNTVTREIGWYGIAR